MIKSKLELRQKMRPILLVNCINDKVLERTKSDLLKVGVLEGTTQDVFN